MPRGIFDADDAYGMPAWPHAGFHVHDAAWAPDGDGEFAKRLPALHRQAIKS